jgi:uncharacterized protein
LSKSPETIKELSLLVGYDNDGPYLVGGKCKACRTVVFPQRPICPNCIGRDIDEVSLSRKGKLYTYTEVYQKPPDYPGEVPYLLGRVYLQDGVFILTQLKARKEELKVNMDMELVVDPIYHDENGIEHFGYKFKPV